MQSAASEPCYTALKASSGTKREKQRLKTLSRGLGYFSRMLEMNPTVIVCPLGRKTHSFSAAFDEALQRKKDWRGTNLRKPRLSVLASRCLDSHLQGQTKPP